MRWGEARNVSHMKLYLKKVRHDPAYEQIKQMVNDFRFRCTWTLTILDLCSKFVQAKGCCSAGHHRWWKQRLFRSRLAKTNRRLKPWHFIMAKRSKVAHFTLTCPATKLEMQPTAEFFSKGRKRTCRYWYGLMMIFTMSHYYHYILLNCQKYSCHNLGWKLSPYCFLNLCRLFW